MTSFCPMASQTSHRARVESNFKAAALRLQSVIPDKTCARITAISFPIFDDIDNVENKAEELEKSIETFIKAHSEARERKGHSRKIQNATVSWFRASYPFVTLFLTVAKEGSAVSPPKATSNQDTNS